MNLTRIIKIFLLLLITIHDIQSIETTILQHLTKHDQSTLILASEFMNMLETQRNFNQQQFTCLTLLPVNFITNNNGNRKQQIHKLNVTYNYEQQRKKIIKQQQQQKQKIDQQKQQLKSKSDKKIAGYKYQFDYDKILDLLHGTCVIYETNSFLYEYCHKQKVRQFDDVWTRQRMAKPQFQDIAMGYYNYQSALQQSTSPHNQGLKPGNAMYQIQYNQNGDLTILTKLLQDVPQLTIKQKQLLKKTVGKGLGVDNKNIDDLQQSSPDTSGNNNNNNNGIKIKSLPTRSVIYDQQNLFTIDTVDHKQYHFNKQTKIIHLNYPIVRSNKYFTAVKIVYEVVCFKSVKGNSTKQEQYISKGVVVGTFQVLFMGDIQQCQQIKQIGYRPLQQKPYDEPMFMNRLRVIGDIAYGYVQQVCMNNWDWQYARSNSKNNNGYISSFTTTNKLSTKKANYLQQGMTLWLQIAINSTSTSPSRVTFHHYPITVKHIIADGIVQMDENIFGKVQGIINKYQLQQQKISTGKLINRESPGIVVWVNSCRVITKQKINKSFHTVQNQIINKNVIKIKQRPVAQSSSKLLKQDIHKKSGDEILCLCKFRKYGEHFLQLHLTLGNKLFEADIKNNYFAYFQFYESQRTVKTVQQKDKQLYTLCSSGGLMCFDVIQQQQNNHQSQQPQKLQQQYQHKGFTTITKLTPLTQPLTDGQTTIDTNSQIIIISSAEHSIVKLTTINQQGQKYYYIITTTTIIKYQQHINGTKQVYKQNAFYENETSMYYNSWFSTFVYVHKGYLWRANDKIIFPRMQMDIDQRLIKIQSLTGSVFVRTWDILKMMHGQRSNMVTGVDEMFDKYYQRVNVAIYKESQQNIQNGKQNQQKRAIVGDSQGNSNEQQQQQQTIFSAQEQSILKQSLTNNNNNILQQNNSQQQQQQQLPKQQQQPSRPQQSVSLRYQYFHGDYCAQPINKFRRTNVIMQCNQAWMRILQVRETSPCVYEMVVGTRLLCRQGLVRGVDKIQGLIDSNSNGLYQSRIKLQKQIVCYPDKAWDDALYVYDVENKDLEFNTK